MRMMKILLLKMITRKKLVGKAASINERTPRRTMEMEIQQVVFENCLIVVSRS